MKWEALNSYQGYDHIEETAENGRVTARELLNQFQVASTQIPKWPNHPDAESQVWQDPFDLNFVREIYIQKGLLPH